MDFFDKIYPYVIGVGIAIFFLWSLLAPLYDGLKKAIYKITRWLRENFKERKKEEKERKKEELEGEQLIKPSKEEKIPSEEFNPIVQRWLERIRHIETNDREILEKHLNSVSKLTIESLTSKKYQKEKNELFKQLQRLIESIELDQ